MNRLFCLSACAIAAMMISLASAHAKTPGQVPLPNGDFSQGTVSWSFQTNDDADTQFKVEEGALRISRKKGAYFLRAYRDVAVKPNRAYEMTFRIKVEGGGTGAGWINVHTAKDQWLEDVLCFSPVIHPGDWQTVKVRVPVIAGMDTLRLNFGPRGQNTTVWIDDVTLHQSAPAKSEVPLIPALDMRPHLDGKLDEGFWRFALKLDDFRVLGQPDRPANPKTQVRLAIHENMLWIAYQMDEPNPAGIRTEVDQSNDIAIYNDDCAETFISLHRKFATQLDVSALGHYATAGKAPIGPPPARTWYDNQILTKAQTLRWEAAAERDATGWTVEMKIPLPPVFGQDMIETDAQGRPIVYVNFGRHRPQDSMNPYSNWAGLTGDTFFAPSQFKPMVLDWQSPLAANKPQGKITRSDFTYRPQQPDHLIVGDPVLAQWNETKVALPAKLKWEAVGLKVDDVVKEIVTPGVVGQLGKGTWPIRCRLWKQGQLPREVTAQQAKRLNSDEAFYLDITSKGIEVSGKTHAAVMRGLATLTLLCDGAKSRGESQISTGTILDAPVMPIRGWLLKTNSPESIIRQAKVLYLLRYNLVMFDATGYGRDAKFPFDSHPNLGSKTTTKKQWAQAADTIRALGMTPLPMAMVWSRCRFIANKPEYNHLAVRPDLKFGTYSKRRADKNLSAALEESYQLVFDLLDELVDTLKVKNIHLALDEIFFDELVTDPASKKLGMTRSDWLIKVVNRTNNHLKKQGVRTWMWSDCLDPSHNARHFEMSASEMRAKLPKDVVIHDWQYAPTGPFTSLKMFKDDGFTTVSGSWFRIPNVINLIGDTQRYGADGFVGTSWGSTGSQTISPELVTALSLGAYLSWSPQDADHMDQFEVVPASLYQTASYRHGINGPAERSSIPVKTSQSLVSGSALIDALRLPGTAMPDALSAPMTGPWGCEFQPFTQDGQPAAVMVHGNQTDTVTIPLQGTASAIAILHTTNRQSFEGSMHQMGKEYKDAVPVRYVLEYADGSTAQLPVVFRRQINAWDDRFAAAQAWPILFGTIGDAYHINIPAMLWSNPHPSKKLKALKMMSGNRPSMDVAMFAVTLIR